MIYHNLLDIAKQKNFPLHTAANQSRSPSLQFLREKIFIPPRVDPEKTWLDSLTSFLSSRSRLCLLHGKWGSGKSILTYLIEEHLLNEWEGFVPLYIDVSSNNWIAKVESILDRLKRPEILGIGDRRNYLFILDGCREWDSAFSLIVSRLFAFKGAKYVVTSQATLPDMDYFVLPDSDNNLRRDLADQWTLQEWSDDDRRRYLGKDWMRIETFLCATDLKDNALVKQPRCFSHLATSLRRIQLPTLYAITGQLLQQCLDSEQLIIMRCENRVRDLRLNKALEDETLDGNAKEILSIWKDFQPLGQALAKTEILGVNFLAEDPIFTADENSFLLGFKSNEMRVFDKPKSFLPNEWGATCCLAVQGAIRAIGGEKGLALWDGQSVKTSSNEESAKSIVFTNNQLAVAISSGIQFWDISTLKLIRSIKSSSPFERICCWGVIGSDLLVGIDKNKFHYIYSNSWKSTRKRPESQLIEISSKGETVAFATSKNQIFIGSFWNDAQDKLLRNMMDVKELALSPSGHALAIISEAAVTVLYLDTEKEQSIVEPDSTAQKITWGSNSLLYVLWNKKTTWAVTQHGTGQEGERR